MTTDTERNALAIVQGSERSALALFITDSNGDLVDIEYLCRYSCAASMPDALAGALPWPAFDFGEYGAYCRDCGEVIETVPNSRPERACGCSRCTTQRLGD